MKLLLLIALAASLLGCGGKPDDKKPAGKPAVPVRLAQAEIRDVPRRLELTGRTEADASVTLKARVDGQVLAVPFAEGQHVAQGDVLVQLDPADLRARLAQAEANLAKSRAQAARARADVERYVALRQKGFISEEKVAEVRTAAQTAGSTEQADAAAAEVARLQLAHATIRAPFAGVVGARLVFPGTTVKANDTALAVINRIQPLRVGFAVPEKYLPQLHDALRTGRDGLRANVATPGGKAIEGAVRFLDNSVDTATGTILLKAELPNADAALTPGQFVNVALVLETLRGAIVVPAEAVQQGSAGSFVFLAREGKVAVREVRIAVVQDGMAVIAAGLAAGEAVVTEGQLRLTDGAAYRVASDGDTPPKAASRTR
ncbi:MAG: efflux RND transporter periplasmic adaptor subunit [Pseudomonadota bacterium]